MADGGERTDCGRAATDKHMCMHVKIEKKKKN